MIKLSNVTKVYAGLSPVVNDINLEVEDGEICVLLGPSGCGKTTTLKMINRLVQPTSGKIFINGNDTAGFDVVQLRRQIGYVIQQIGLFPNMTVEENLCVVPNLLGWDKVRAKRRASELLEIVALDPATFLQRYPKDLSGGQQQRIGVARALATDPPVMLMDEPFGAIDPINRSMIQDEFLRIQKKVKKTIVFVSHDIDEAVKMADKIAIFRAGKLEQVGAPDDILARPANAFVADFVGSDRALKRLRLQNAERIVSAIGCAIQIGSTAKEAIELMQTHGMDKIIMVGGDGKPQGFFDLARLTDPLETLTAEKSAALEDTVGIKDDLRTVVSTMLANGTTWLPTVAEDGTFHGYVNQVDVVDLLRLPVGGRS